MSSLAAAMLVGHTRDTRGTFMKRWHVIAGFVVLVLATLLVLSLIPSTGPTPANVKKIKRGMTQAEVEAILGPPTSEQWYPDNPDESRATWWTIAAWEPSDGYLVVVFYGGQVDDFAAGFEPSLLQQLARRLGLGP